MDQDEHNRLLEQRLAALEARLESFSGLAESVADLSQRIEKFSKLEELIDRLQDNFLMIADIDTFLRLRNLLAEGKFKEADEETTNVLMGYIRKTSETISPDDIENYPEGPLKIVDRLWRKYSDDRFGLSIQLQKYKDVGGDLNTLIAQDTDLFLQFCDRVGWRQNDKLIVRENWEVSPDAPEGFLPLSFWVTPYGLKIANFILARLLKLGF
jgi:hypothetical protein